MSEEAKKYTGSPRGGAGLGQGRKKTKDYKRRTFILEVETNELLEKFNHAKFKILSEVVEIAILELNRQFENTQPAPQIDEQQYLNFDAKKETLFSKMKDLIAFREKDKELTENQENGTE